MVERSSRDLIIGDDGRTRCAWVGTDAEYQRYHDEEWGTPVHDRQALFEKICLEGFQAGLSWITILRRRPAFRELFAEFEPERLAAFSADDVERLLADPRIIRHRGKIEAAIGNARACLALTTPLPELIWRAAPEPRASRYRSLTDIPTMTRESHALSMDLRKAGFRFVGPTTMYALMQSCGLVDDHLAGCWRSQ